MADLTSNSLTILAALSLSVWVYLIFLRGNYWRCDQRLPAELDFDGPWPEVAILIPARNEADSIGECLASVLDQDYPGELTVIVADDHSDDSTGEIAKRTADRHGREGDVTVVRAKELPEGWAGKLWALNEAFLAIPGAAPDAAFLWLSDADIRHESSNLRRLVAKALSDDRDLVSLMAHLRVGDRWSRLLIPPFIYFFQMLYPFRWVADPKKRTAAAAGGCVLLKRAAFEAAGGFPAIKSALIDDCTLASLMKAGRDPANGRIWIGLSDEAQSLRAYRGLSEIWNMVARSAYTQLRYSPLLLFATLAGMGLTFLAPPLALILGAILGDFLTCILGLIAWALMAASFWPTVALYNQSPRWTLTLPLAATLYTMMTTSSAWRHWTGQGASWKNRTHRGLAGAGQGR